MGTMKESAAMKNLFWIDLEMTGLDDTVDRILEVAVVITDINFNSLEEYHAVIYQPPEILEAMHDWCKKTHKETGLTAAIPNGRPLEEVENELVALSKRHFAGEERIVLAGNSVGNDKRFIDRYMTKFSKLLHYRLVDVSSFKEIYRSKYRLTFDKKNTHRAMEDIQESIDELKFYLSYVKPPLATPVTDTATSKA